MANPKLTVLFEKLRGKTFELDKPELTVGRKDAADICIKDSSLSGLHCTLIRTESGSYILRDENSTNGTRINNVPVTEQELKNSDIIQLGGVEVLYDNSEGGSTAGSNPSATGLGGRTHTINLDSLETNLSTVRELTNYSPFAQVEHKKQAMTHKILIGGLALLGLALIAVVVVVGIKVLSVSE